MQVETTLGKARRDASHQSPHGFDPEARIDVRDVGALLGHKSQSSVYGKTAAGEIPPPVIRTHRFTRWRRGDIIDFLRAGCDMSEWRRQRATRAGACESTD